MMIWIKGGPRIFCAVGGKVDAVGGKGTRNRFWLVDYLYNVGAWGPTPSSLPRKYCDYIMH